MITALYLILLISLPIGIAFFVCHVRDPETAAKAPKQILKNELGEYKIQFRTLGKWFDLQKKEFDFVECGYIYHLMLFDTELAAKQHIALIEDCYKRQLKKEMKRKIKEVKRNSWR